MIWIAIAHGTPNAYQTWESPIAGPGRAQPQIVRGMPEPGFPSVVSLGVSPISICSGNLITPRIVLTAAHCSGELPLEFVVEFGNALFGDDAASPNQSIGLSDARIHPDYVPLQNGITLGEFDIAVAVLEEAATVEPTLFRTLPLTEDSVGLSVFSVGFGIDENDVGGVKRSAPLTISAVDSFFVVSDSQDNNNEANICSGDSGGPQFMETPTGWVQVAVHSWADVGCDSTSGSTRTDVAARWILDQVEDVHGTRDLCEAAGRYDDGICDECPRFDFDCLPADVRIRLDAKPRACGTQVQRPVGLWSWLSRH